jgi:ribose transport system ATP-binding protein
VTADIKTARTLAIEMRSISKSFSGVAVLRDVSFELEAGEVHALAGENGAGKSTLMKILQGVYAADSGQILAFGNEVMITDTFAAREASIGMVFQEFSLISTLTVAQNVFLTSEPLGKFGIVDDREARHATARVFSEMGVEIDPTVMQSSLSTAYWQLTEIAKALAQDAKVLIMDEPTATLAKHEAEALFELIGRLKARGISIIYISHRMDEIFRIADRITVLRDGRKVMSSALSETTPSKVVEAIVGRQIASQLEYRERTNIDNEVGVLAVKNLSSGSLVKNVSFTLHKGEILGLAGLMGSGRTELVQALFGIDKLSDGEVFIEGRKIAIKNPQTAIEHGLALIPEDRREQGLVLDHSVRDNLLLPLLDQVLTAGFIRQSRVGHLLKDLITRFSIKVADSTVAVEKLSGGNQQKVVIAKWLGTNPRVLMMDEPTAGVDIGTKSEILEMVRSIADEGRSVIFISSELPELLAVSDRILLLRNGEIINDLSRSEIPSEEYLQLAIQGTHNVEFN